jgi:hypothetical protein
MTIWLINRRDRYASPAGDQVSYLAQGYPAARFTEPNENFAHQHQIAEIDKRDEVAEPNAVLDPHIL